jgi:ATP-dependent protease ClpP protease subunit
MKLIATLSLVVALLNGGVCKEESDADITSSPVDSVEQTPIVNSIRFDTDVSDESLATLETMFKAVKASQQKVLVIEVNSPGGRVAAGFKIAKLIENAPFRVVCIVDGEADSMAFYVFESCHERYMTPRSKLMAHEPKIESPNGGDRFVLKRQWQSLEAESHAMAEHYAKHLKMTLQQVESRIAAQDWWMGWKDALKFHAVDGIRSVEEVVEAGKIANTRR